MYRPLEKLEVGLKEVTINKIQKTLSNFPSIEQAILYGSRATGTYKNGSDIDLCLMGEALDSTVILRLDDLIDELFLPYTLDISIYDKIDDKKFKEHIDRVGVCFYSK